MHTYSVVCVEGLSHNTQFLNKKAEESKEYFRGMDRLYGGLSEKGHHGLIYLNT